MRRLLAFILMVFIWGTIQAQENSDSVYVPANTVVKVSYNNDFILIKLHNNKYAKAFLDMLPITIYMDQYIDNTTLASSINYNFPEEEIEPALVSKGDLYFYPSLKQLRFIHDFYTATYTVLPIGRQVGNKEIFKEAYNGAEVTFSR